MARLQGLPLHHYELLKILLTNCGVRLAPGLHQIALSTIICKAEGRSQNTQEELIDCEDHWLLMPLADPFDFDQLHWIALPFDQLSQDRFFKQEVHDSFDRPLVFEAGSRPLSHYLNPLLRAFGLIRMQPPARRLPFEADARLLMGYFRIAR